MAAPNLPTGHYTGEDFERIWYYARWWFGEHQMFVAVGVGVALAGTLLMLIVGLWLPKNAKDDDDYDYEEF